MIKNLTGYIILPAIFLWMVLFVDLEPGQPAITYTLAIAMLMAGWWIMGTIPLAATALLPVILFPAFGVMNGKAVSSAYFNHVIFLFIGGFIMALAMQKWDLHKRMALRILLITGTSASRVMLGFMLATAFLSMWISNTATAMMMVPIVLSISSKFRDYMDTESSRRFSAGLLLGVAYSASIGGVATLVGTPPNLSFARIFQIMFPQAPEISFGGWFIFALPVSMIMLALTWALLWMMYRPKKAGTSPTGSILRQEYRAMGRATTAQRRVMFLFVVMALLWLTRADLEVGNLHIPGWSSLLPKAQFVNDGTVAIAISIILFLVPSGKNFDSRLMDWESTIDLPWNIVLLFGGGFALASAFKESGLSLWFGDQMMAAGNLPLWLIVVIIALLMTFLTELTSNTATTEMILPVLAGLAISLEVNPLLFMIPATISGSMAFMLPVATPPNAIVFGSNQITMAQMTRTGILLNLIGAAIIVLATLYWGSAVFEIDMNQMPDWATLHK